MVAPKTVEHPSAGPSVRTQPISPHAMGKFLGTPPLRSGANVTVCCLFYSVYTASLNLPHRPRMPIPLQFISTIRVFCPEFADTSTDTSTLRVKRYPLKETSFYPLNTILIYSPSPSPSITSTLIKTSINQHTLYLFQHKPMLPLTPSPLTASANKAFSLPSTPS